MADKLIETGFKPRKHQLILHNGLKRFTVSVTHRRFGKTHYWVNRQITKANAMTLHKPRLFYVAPTYNMAKKIAWDIFKTFTHKIPGVSYNENDLRIDFSGNDSRIQLLSAENPRANVGIYADDVVFDEFGDMVPSVWTEVFRPTLSDRGGTAAFAGTLRGTNHFWEMYQRAISGDYPDWAGFLFKASETGIIHPDELADLKRDMPEEEYLQEYECDPHAAGAIGSYWAKNLALAGKEDRITEVPYDSALPVDTYWDLGVSDAMAIWFVQSTRGRHQIINYMERVESDLTISLKKLRELPYVYGRTVLPHDAQVRALETGRSRVEYLYSQGVKNITVVPRVPHKIDSIDAARRIMSSCYFDRKNCEDGLKKLQQYKKSWNEKTMSYGDNPRHDFTSHAADSFQCFAMSARESSTDSQDTFTRANRNRSGQLEAERYYSIYQRGRE